MSEMTRRGRRHCPHAVKRGVYGREAEQHHGRHLQCVDCGRYLDGPDTLKQSMHDRDGTFNAGAIPLPCPACGEVLYLPLIGRIVRDDDRSVRGLNVEADMTAYWSHVEA